MAAPRFCNIAKLLHAPALAAAMLFAFSGGGLSSPIPAHPIPAPSISSTSSASSKGQATSPAGLIDRWSPLITEASRRFGVSQAWIRAVIRVESGGRTSLEDGRPIISKAGAMGIMQIMPETYRDMRHQYGLGADPYDPHDNVLAGTAYLRWLYEKYGYPKMFAAYNAGPGTLEAQFAGIRQLPQETFAYVRDIARILGTKSAPSQLTGTLAASQPRTMPATLTRPDGSLISIDPAAVDSIRAPLPNEYAPGVQTVVAMGNVRQGVREDLASVASVIRNHGGKV